MKSKTSRNGNVKSQSSREIRNTTVLRGFRSSKPRDKVGGLISKKFFTSGLKKAPPPPPRGPSLDPPQIELASLHALSCGCIFLISLSHLGRRGWIFMHTEQVNIPLHILVCQVSLLSWFLFPLGSHDQQDSPSSTCPVSWTPRRGNRGCKTSFAMIPQYWLLLFTTKKKMILFCLS